MFGRRFMTLAVLAATASYAETARAQECALLRYTFQPDCYRPSLDAPCDKRKTGMRLDLGPQIAVWVESAEGGRFVDTLMVTSLVATRGLGNRPGQWKLPSSPKFPYGKRPMALPVWAHRRGKLYDTLVMQDGLDKESWLGFHEAISSPDPYYCRPMSLMEIDVDAITCPTVVFNSVKGRFARASERVPKTPYPPRNDLTMFTDRDCDEPASGGCSMEKMSATKFAELNDLDAVATATPPYGTPFRGTWTIPSEIADGDYALFVEINKEFDGNASFTYESPYDPQLSDSGLRNNYGQPSVVFRVPFSLDRRGTQQATTADVVGYGDWDGATGTLHRLDQKISDSPGSGRGRLLTIVEPSVASGGEPLRGKVHVVVESRNSCPAGVAGAGRVVDLEVLPASIGTTEAEIRFREPTAPLAPVERYEVRYREGRTMTLEAFRESSPAPSVATSASGASRAVKLTGLKPATTYVVGVRGAGCCISNADLATVSFETAEMKFRQLSGCFVATAAYGSGLASAIEPLRALRDRELRRTVAGALGVDLYERASPPLAAVLGTSETGKALVRTLLTPIVSLLTAPEK